MPTSTVAFDVMFEFANDTSQAVTLQLAAQGSEPNHVTPIILLQSGESVSLVLVAGSSYRYTVKQHSRKAQIWCALSAISQELFLHTPTA